MRRRMMLAVLLATAMMPLMAEYSVLCPSRLSPEEFQVMDEDGETIALDDYVYSLKWNGLSLEQLEDGIYAITEGSETVIVATWMATPEAIEDSLRFYWGNPKTLITHGALPDAEDAADWGIGRIITLRRIPKIEERLFQIEGIEVTEARSGDIIDIINGLPAEYEEPAERVIVTCPDCGHSFTIYI